MRHAVVIEEAGDGYSAYVPELPGCIATGSSLAEVERLIAKAIELHVTGLMMDGDVSPAKLR